MTHTVVSSPPLNARAASRVINQFWNAPSRHLVHLVKKMQADKIYSVEAFTGNHAQMATIPINREPPYKPGDLRLFLSAMAHIVLMALVGCCRSTSEVRVIHVCVEYGSLPGLSGGKTLPSTGEQNRRHAARTLFQVSLP